jgi:endonuclease YncB( thermonuclease family)
MPRAPVVAALALFLGPFFLAADARGSRPFAERGTVTAVVDAVTVEVRISDGTGEQVQLFGVAAPLPTSCAVTQATADAAALALGKPVWLVAVQGAPPKNRGLPLVAVVILPGGPDLGLQLVKRGDGTVRTDERPFKKRAAYVRAEKAAQAAELGLWGCKTQPAAGAPSTTTTTTQGQGHKTGNGKGHGQGQEQRQGHGRSNQTAPSSAADDKG